MSDLASKVLAVEDATGTIREIAGDLKDAGIQVEFAENIPTSALKLRENDYDVLLVDIMIVGADGAIVEDGGLEVLRRLRAGEFGIRNAGTPFYVLTGQKPSLDEQALADIPGCLGIEKKLLQHLLLNKIKAYIDEKKSRGQKCLCDPRA